MICRLGGKLTGFEFNGLFDDAKMGIMHFFALDKIPGFGSSSY